MSQLRINKLQIVNNTHLYGPKKRLMVVLQGCSLHCKGCINKHLWSFNGGHLINIKNIIQLTKDLDGITLFGGEPLDQANELYELVKQLKLLNKTIILFTGYLKKELNKIQTKIWNLADIVKSGRFDISKLNTNLQFRGSTNQKVYCHKGKYYNFKLNDGYTNSILTINNNGYIDINGFYTNDIGKVINELIEDKLNNYKFDDLTKAISSNS